MWSRQEEKRALQKLNAYYAKETTEKRLNQLLMMGLEISYQNIETQFPVIEEREKARIMSLYINGAPLNE